MSNLFKSFIEKIFHKLVYVTCNKLGLKYIEGHLVVTKILTDRSIVIDLGANRGAFSKEIAKQFRSHCYCLEPNPKLFKNIVPTDFIQTYNIAIAEVNGKMKFTLSDNEEASSFFPGIVEKWGIKESVLVETTTLNYFCKTQDIKRIDLLKVDIEGSEIGLISSMSDVEIKKIPQITLEFHEFLDFSLEQPTKQAIKRMESLGFLTIVYSRNKYADVLFINKDYFKLGLVGNLWYALHRFVAYKM